MSEADLIAELASELASAIPLLEAYAELLVGERRRVVETRLEAMREKLARARGGRS